MTQLSVLTPSFNYADYIEDALQSVAHLDLSTQHVVIDDGSTDDSLAILNRWSDALVLRTQANAGLAATLNRCLALAEGEWIGWLNADDFYLPAVSEVLSNAARDTDVVYGDSVFVDDSSRVLRLFPQHGFSPSVLRRYGPFIAPPSFFVRRTAMASITWDENTIKLMDWDLYLSLHEAGARFAYVPLPLGAFRRHQRQQSNQVTPAAETIAVRKNHGLHVSHPHSKLRRQIGGLHHAGLKLTSGAYRRQRAGRQHEGKRLDWWYDPSAMLTIGQLNGL